MFRAPIVRLIRTVYEHIGTGFVTGSLAFGYYLSHLEETPITGRKRFLIYSRKKAEKRSQKEFEKCMKKYAGSIIPPQHPQSQRVTTLLNRLLDANKDLPEIHTKNWSVNLVDGPIQIAFIITNNGGIFVPTDDLQSSDDELATTLSHEIAHSLLGHDKDGIRHINILKTARILLTIFWMCLPVNWIGLIIIYIFGWQLLNIMFHYPYSRKLESEADQVGLLLAAKACFDVRSAVVHWHKQALLEGTNQPREWYSTHPSHTTRQNELEKQLPSAIRVREQCDCPELPCTDPRESMKLFEEAVAKAKQG